MREALYWIFILSAIAMMLIPHSFVQASQFIAGGDWGCKTAAQNNLKQISKTGLPVVGLGDYGYSCSDKTLTSMWNQIQQKTGVQGNHECQKGQNTAFGQKTFGYSDCRQSGRSATLGNIGFILMNDYQSYSVGSKQYNRVIANAEKFQNNSNIDLIAFAYHEPTHGLKCSGSHCHGDKTDFAKIYDPIIKKYHGLILEGHTHLVGFGSPNSIPTAQCGGGGEDGTTVKTTSGFDYGSATMGYCQIDIQKDKIVAQHFSQTGQLLHTHTWNR